MVSDKKQKLIDEYMHAKIDLRVYAGKDPRFKRPKSGMKCGWCDTFKENEFMHCLNCGRIFE